MRTFWSDEDGFSIKDFFAIVVTTNFLALCWMAVFKPLNSIVPTVLSILSPIVITILGGYVLTEGARGITKTVLKKGDDEVGTI